MQLIDGMPWNCLLNEIMHNALSNWGSTVPYCVSELFDRIALNIKNKLYASVHRLGYRKVRNIRS